MVSQLITSPFVVGLVIGFCGSSIGALVDFLNSRRKGGNFSYGGLMLVIAGLINSIMGIAAITFSLLETSSILTAVIVGLGVLIGFAVGFLSIAGVWICFGKKNELA
jgi:cytosine/uracil/thiamine/allantoin permease